MPKLPSERFYFNRNEHSAVFGGLDILESRIDATKKGSYSYQRRPVEWEGGTDAYIDREYNEDFYQAIIKLKKKFGGAQRGRYRLNLTEITLVAFAFRFARKLLRARIRGFDDFERRLENTRRRILGATVRKFGLNSYQEFKARWNKFNAWCHFHLMYSELYKRHLRPARPTFKSSHRAEFRQYRGWIRQIIDERCESGISKEDLALITRKIKRHARQRRFAGLTSSAMLANRTQHQEKIFAYVQRHLNLPLKFQLLPLETRLSVLKARLQNPAPPASLASLTPMAPGTASAVQPARLQPQKSASRRPKYGVPECSAMVLQFLQKFQPEARPKILKDAGWMVRYSRISRISIKGAIPPPMELMNFGGAPFPRHVDDDQYWESGWIIRALAHYMSQSEMGAVLYVAWTATQAWATENVA